MFPFPGAGAGSLGRLLESCCHLPWHRQCHPWGHLGLLGQVTLPPGGESPQGRGIVPKSMKSVSPIL